MGVFKGLIYEYTEQDIPNLIDFSQNWHQDFKDNITEIIIQIIHCPSKYQS